MAPRGARGRAPGAEKGAGRAKKPFKERAREFAFDGVPEKDRFGIFDPGLRGLYIFGFMLGCVVAVGGVFDAWGSAAVAFGIAAVLFLTFLVVGVVGYRTIWRSPGEREILLRMAREDDEARHLRAKLARERAAESGRKDGPNEGRGNSHAVAQHRIDRMPAQEALKGDPK